MYEQQLGKALALLLAQQLLQPFAGEDSAEVAQEDKQRWLLTNLCGEWPRLGVLPCVDRRMPRRFGDLIHRVGVGDVVANRARLLADLWKFAACHLAQLRHDWVQRGAAFCAQRFFASERSQDLLSPLLSLVLALDGTFPSLDQVA